MTTATDFAIANSIAKTLLSDADSGAPTAKYAKAKIAALQMAAEAKGGAIAPNIRELGEACQSMTGFAAQISGRMLMYQAAENIFEITTLGKLVASYLPALTQDQP